MKKDNIKIINEYDEKIQHIYKEYTDNLNKSLNNISKQYTISDLEESLSSANKKTKKALIDVTSNILSSVDEVELIHIKKKQYKEKGINLVVKDVKTRSLLTTQGKLIFSRKILRPSSKEAESRLINAYNVKSIVLRNHSGP